MENVITQYMCYHQSKHCKYHRTEHVKIIQERSHRPLQQSSKTIVEKQHDKCKYAEIHTWWGYDPCDKSPHLSMHNRSRIESEHK